MEEQDKMSTIYSTHPYLQRRWDAVGRKLGFSAEDKDTWKAWRQKTARKLRSLIGYDTMGKAPLNPEITEEEYYQIISDKTASLIASGCEVGAYLTSGSSDIATRFRGYGEHLGRAFQITDDLLDYVGDEETIGKPTGNDVRAGTVTLPLIQALSHAPRTDTSVIYDLLNGDWSEDAWPVIVDFTHKHGGIDYARRQAQEYGATAKAHLDGIKDSPAKQSLLAMVDYAIGREK